MNFNYSLQTQKLIDYINSINSQAIKIIKNDNKGQYDLPLDGSCNLIYGPAQSGKTSMIVCISMIHSYINQCPVIIILRNSSDDSLQLRHRCDKIFDDYNKFIKQYGYDSSSNINIKTFNYCYVGNSSVDIINDAMKNNKIIIAIANINQIEKIINAISATPNMKYVTIIDEVDHVSYGKKLARFRTLLNLGILDGSGKTYGVTATSFDMIFTEEKIKSSNIIHLYPKNEYHGINNIDMRCINETIVPISKNRDWSDDNVLIPILNEYSSRDVYGNDINSISSTSFNIHQHPMIWLIKSTHLKIKQIELMDRIFKLESNWKNVIVYNGGGLFIQSPYNNHIKDIARSLSYNKIKKGKNPLFGTDLINIKAPINAGIQFFRELVTRYKINITHIAIISDELADRCISFVSQDYKWHLSGQYYIPSPKTTVSNIIQSIRLCGNYEKTDGAYFPLKLFTTKKVCEDLVKGFNVQEELLDRVVNNKNDIIQYENNDISLPNLLKNIKINIKKLPKNKFGNLDKKKINIIQVVTDNNDGGIDQHIYDKILSKITDITISDKSEEENNIHSLYSLDDFIDKNDEIKSSFEEIGSYEYNRLVTKMFPIWSNVDNNTKISLFMKDLDPVKRYDINEFSNYIKEHDIIKQHVLNIRVNKTNGFGTIIKHNNDNFYLHPCLVEKFNEYFD